MKKGWKNETDKSRLTRAYEDLRQSNLRFKYATKAASDAIWDWDLQTNELYWGDGFKTLFGHDQTMVKINDRFWKEHVHPNDVARVLAGIQNVLSDSIQTAWEDEYLYSKADSTYAIVMDKGLIIRDANGRAIRMIGAMKDVTRFRKHEDALIESNERFGYAVKATSQAIWEWNAIAPDSFKEYGYDDLFGYDIPDHIGDITFWASKVHPEDYKKVSKMIADTKSDPKKLHWKLEYRFSKSDGKYIFIKDKATLIRDNHGNLVKIFGAMQDITREKHEEQKLRLMELAITNTTNGVVIAGINVIPDFGPRVMYINKSFMEMTGYTPAEMTAKGPRILYGPKTDRKELDRLWQAMENREACEIEVINYTKTGMEIWVQLSVIPAQDTNGQYSHFIAIFRDITERKYHELEREKMIADLSHKIKDLRQFTYITSHNLRSPLANMLGLINLTEDIEVQDETLKMIHAGFKTSAESLLSTINDLMGILNTRDNQVIRKEENIVSDVFNHVLNQVINITDEIHPIIVCDFKDAPVIRFHKVYFESILLNLLTNALKYRSLSRPLYLRISTKTIKDKIELTFEDNGIGLDVNRHRERIFGFYQKFHDNSDSKGLGLYLVKSQMEELGGKVAIESEVNKGTRLILSFKI